MKLDVQTRLGQYQQKLDEADTRDKMLDVLLSMEDGFVGVALDVLRELSDAEFDEFRAGVTLERSGQENSDDWYEKYLDLLVPPPFAALLMVADGQIPEED